MSEERPDDENLRSRLGSLAGADGAAEAAGDSRQGEDPGAGEGSVDPNVEDSAAKAENGELEPEETQSAQGSLDFPDVTPVDQEAEGEGLEPDESTRDEEGAGLDLSQKSRARTEHEELLRGLHEPLGVPPADPFGGGEDEEEHDVLELNDEESRDEPEEVSPEELRDLAGAAPGEAKKDGEKAGEDNVFERVASFTRNAFDGRKLSRRMRRTTLIGSVLLVTAAGTLAYQNDTSARALGLVPPPHQVVVERSSFQSVWAIVATSGEWARDEGASREPAYREGARQAGWDVLGAAFESVTDPEARLAIVGAGLAQALQADDIEAAQNWHTRLQYVPGAREDARAAQLRQRLYERMADRMSGRDEQLAGEWRQRAAVEEPVVDRGEWSVEGEGWTMPSAYQLQKALETVRVEPPQREGAYWKGWRDAMNQALLAFNVETRRMEEVVEDKARLR